MSLTLTVLTLRLVITLCCGYCALSRLPCVCVEYCPPAGPYALLGARGGYGMGYSVMILPFAFRPDLVYIPCRVPFLVPYVIFASLFPSRTPHPSAPSFYSRDVSLSPPWHTPPAR